MRRRPDDYFGCDPGHLSDRSRSSLVEILSTRLRVTFFVDRSYRSVVLGSACPARYWTSSLSMPSCEHRSVSVATRKLCGV